MSSTNKDNYRRSDIYSRNNDSNDSNQSSEKYNSKIMILDDDFDIATIIKLNLQKQGFNDVFVFTEPSLALKEFRKNHNNYSLVISDIRMPGMNGFEFVREARKINPKVKVLLMTAFEIDYKEFARVLPKPKIDGLIHKPISIRKLNGLIKSYMTTK